MAVYTSFVPRASHLGSDLNSALFCISGEKTGGLMGVSEMVLSCCFCGCTMALFSGQPLLIVGATGPLLVFEEAVYAVSRLGCFFRASR